MCLETIYRNPFYMQRECLKKKNLVMSIYFNIYFIKGGDIISVISGCSSRCSNSGDVNRNL
jgi:hypothetical protein